MIEKVFDSPIAPTPGRESKGLSPVIYGVNGLPKGDKCKVPLVTSFAHHGQNQTEITSKPTIGKK